MILDSKRFGERERVIRVHTMTNARKGLVIIYYGDGKGKTTAAMGLAVRALGRGLKVHVIQFIKGTWSTGEMGSLQRLGADFQQMGKGFYKIMNDQLPPEEHIKAARNGLQRALEILNRSKGLSPSVIPDTIGNPENKNKKEQIVISSEDIVEAEKSDVTRYPERAKRAEGSPRGVSQTPVASQPLDYARDDNKNGIDILILDEILRAVQEGLLTKEDINDLINRKPPEFHLVMTGHTVWPELVEQADMVTEMKKIKHPFDRGILAQIGVDF